jgi:hypothetical protein
MTALTKPYPSPQKSWWHDPSLWSLLTVNLLTAGLAVKENWNLMTMLWIYWAQSLIIGFFHFLRILRLKNFSTEGLKINNLPVPPTTTTKILVACFFLFHYGMMHVFYLGILSFFGRSSRQTLTGIELVLSKYSSGPAIPASPKIDPWQPLPTADLMYILFSVVLFFFNHLFSYLHHKSTERLDLNLGSFMFYPYLRVVPMHLVVILMLSSTNPNALVWFLLLKTIADCAMHVIEHNFIRQSSQLPKFS